MQKKTLNNLLKTHKSPQKIFQNLKKKTVSCTRNRIFFEDLKIQEEHDFK
jgi:hypothetical protein